jgi:AcrR family transcriptional regulator
MEPQTTSAMLGRRLPADERRAQILREAARLFGSHGFNAAAGDDRAVFTVLALTLLRSVEDDPSILRLILYSALEGHELARPFQEKRILRLREFLTGYIERRTSEGAFRAIDPALAARAFMGMVVDHLIVKHVFGQREQYPLSPEQVADAFVSIFLDGVRNAPAAAPRKSGRG